MSIRQEIVRYVDNIIETYNNFPVSDVEKTINILLEAYENDRLIITIGNGGSG